MTVGPIDAVVVPPRFVHRATGNRVWKRYVAPTLQKLRSWRNRHSSVPVIRSSEHATSASDLDETGRDLLARASGHKWYHTMDLGHGVVTPGFVDHRLQLPQYQLPESMAGLRCLDIATFDGFWAFEFERRGAAEVIALDLPDRTHQDCPRWLLRKPAEFKLTERDDAGFLLAHEAYDSRVKRVEKSVYELDPEVDGMFDLVFISDVLVHLRDPQLAIERAYSVCRGDIIIADVYSPELEGLGDVPVARFLGPGETWWKPNVACLRQMMTVAGFEPVTETSRFRLAAEGGNEIHKVVLRGTAAEIPSWTIAEKRYRAGLRR